MTNGRIGVGRTNLSFTQNLACLLYSILAKTPGEDLSTKMATLTADKPGDLEEKGQQSTKVANAIRPPTIGVTATTSAEQKRNDATHDQVDWYHTLYTALM